MTSEWKTILALTVLLLPLSYCTIQTEKYSSQVELACIEKRGEMWNGQCTFED